MTIPYNFTPRPYQLPLLDAMDSGYKRAVCIWHRRAGKDKTLINLMVKKIMERYKRNEGAGTYFYLFPTYQQGRKILWEGRDKEGFKFLDHIPKELVKSANNTEMKVELITGDIIRIIGTDQIDSIVGTNPVGCIFSEYSLQNPRAWDLLRPILAENGGWAVFNYTPRGHNHGFDLYDMARNNKEWFSQLLTVDDTKAISLEAIDDERQASMDEDLIQQEFYCSFDAAIQGAYYSNQFKYLDDHNHVTNVPWEPNLPVYTFWDLGVGDATAIWFVQVVGREYRVIDYYEATGEGLQHYVKLLKEQPYVYGDHYAPHDIEVREFASGGRSRFEIAQELGINFKVVPRQSIEDGIEAVRTILPQCYFDKENCKLGVSALREYHKEYDEKRKLFRSHPEHDWSSHAADAFRYFATGFKFSSQTTQSRNYLKERMR